MRIFLLLTLTGLAVGQEVDRNCDGRVNGVYASSPCSNEFNHCYNGEVTIKSCPRGLVFNPDSSQCDFDSNVVGCAARAEVSCAGRQDGSYAIGCSSWFFFCSNGIIHQSSCQNGLFYDVDRKTCDHKFRVRACGGHPEVEREPVTRPPLVVPTYSPQGLKSYAKISGYGPVRHSLFLSCEGKYDGVHKIGSCSQQYLYCAGGMSQLAECPNGEVFVAAGICAPKEDAPECSSAASEPRSSFCAMRKDGFYAEKCSSDFIYCEQGVATAMRCASNLLFDEEKGYCDYPEEQCTAAIAPSEKPLPIDCKGKKDGYYSSGCSTNFVFCMNGVASLMTCPPSLVFNKNKGYCDYMESCSEAPASVHTHVAPPTVPISLVPAPASTVVPQSPVIDCKGEKDGYHSKGCTADFVYCVDGIASPMTCPPLLVFNEKKGYCDYVENCSATPAPASAPRPPIVPVPIPSPPAPMHVQPPIGFECMGRPSGYYAKGCTSEFVYCEEGVVALMKCPSSLVFNAEKNYCDYPENCSGGEPVQEKTVQTSSVLTETYSRSSFVCPEPNGTFSKGCSSEFFICSYGVAQPMICPGELVFNAAEGYCDHKEYCQDRHATMVDSDQVYDIVSTDSSIEKATEAVVKAAASSECAHLPDGRYGSLCDPKFMMCSSGVTFFMKCPNDLLFDPRLSRCVYATECSIHPLPQSASNVIVPSSDAHSPAREDCTGKPDGLHSLGCTAEFLQCVDGSAYSLFCPVGLVFVEGAGACDAPSACSQKPKHATSGPVPYQATMASDKSELPDCDTDGYFSQPCASEYYNCVGGKRFAGKCPSGLVFNMEKIYCDYPENCMLGEDVKSPEAQPVPSTVIRKDDSCQGRSDGVIIDDDCQTEFTTCLSGVAYVTKCPARLVYSAKAKLCDYPEACGNNADDSFSSIAYHQALTSEGGGAISISASYQHSSVGAILCKDKRDGPLSSSDCRPSFSFCVNGALYSTICPEGLLYSYASRRDIEGGPLHPTEAPVFEKTDEKMLCLRCKSVSECGSAGDDGTTPEPISYITVAPVRPPSNDSIVVPMVDEFDCSLRANGKYSLGCMERFVLCSSGRAYVRSCPSGLVYNEAKGLCDYECSTSDGSLNDVAQAVHIRPRQKTTKAYSSETPMAIESTPEQIECVMSVALGRCSSRFWRCMNGRLKSAQCPGQSLFDETLSLCVYDLPECRADTTTTMTVTTTVGTSAAPPPIVATEAAYTSAPVYSPQINYGYTAALSNAQSYPSPNMDNPFGLRYPAYVPLPFEDFMHGGDKVNHGPIKFEPRSAISDDTRSRLMDVFDGVKSPWLFPGVSRIFIPYRHYHHRHHGDSSSAERNGDVMTSKLFDVLNPEVPVPVEAAEELEPVIATESQHEDQEAGHEHMVHGDEDVQQDVQEKSVAERDKDTSAHHENLNEGRLKDVLREGEETVRGEEKGEHGTERNEDTEETSVDEQHEGSGQERITRRRRSPSMRTPRDFSVCTTFQSPGLVSIGFCRQDFIFCRAAGSGVMAACPIGDLFDSSTNKCVASERCGEPEVAPLPAAREALSAIAAQKYTPGTAQSVHVFSAHDVPITSTTNTPIAYPPVSTTMKDPVAYPPVVTRRPPVVVYPPPPVAAQDSNSLCLHDTDFAADCSGNFMKCVHGVAYPMKCPAGLVFSQASHYCDYPAAVPACAGMQIEQPPRPEPFPIDSVKGIYVPTQPPAQQRPKPHPKPRVLVQTLSSHGGLCSADPQPIGRCSSKFAVCSNGIISEFNCAKPLVFNPTTRSCDFRGAVSGCEHYQAEDVFEATTTEAQTTAAAVTSCVFDEQKPAFALDYCARTYGMCTEHGVLRRKECTGGFLFDSYMDRCVPAEQCGQERLKELLSKVTFGPPAAHVAPEQSKYGSRKDERCSNSLEGTVKPLGRCRSSYIRCSRGEAIIEPCATTAEVFSSAVGACVLRINAPECHATPQRSPPAYPFSSSNDSAAFCKTRSDGLYRNPIDCAGILQCFGGDVFEYPPCSSGLVFNEQTSKCDYKSAVPECRSASDEKVEQGCRGARHGDFVAHETDCQQFYRCVWDRLEEMRCPRGTVFNPKLSVCDWPANVSQCGSGQKDQPAVEVY